MTISERVQEVFKRFNVNLTVTEEPRTDLAEATLENGTVIYTDSDDFTEGAEAYIINDEGERIPLPQGDYTLSDGSVLTIADGGKVAKIASKGKDGGDGKDGNTPVKSKPEAEAPAEAPAKEAPADSGDSAPTPVKEPTKRTRQSSDEDMEEVTINYVTREEVEAMIAEAVAAMMPQEEVSEDVEAEEDKEEMSVNPEAPKAVEEEVEVKEEKKGKKEEEKEELASQEDPISVELAAVKAELEEMKKQAAEGGLKHKAPTVKAEPINLKDLSTSERVSALLNQFSK